MSLPVFNRARRREVLLPGLSALHLSLAMALGLVAVTMPAAVHAAADNVATSNSDTGPAKNLQEVEVQASTGASALNLAPVQSDLDVTQPTSVIDLDWISNYVAPTADYATIAAISPGVSNSSPAGPGLGESKQMTLRGFNDSQYNVTYDGIPFGDTNDFSHHTSSYFPAKMIGEVDVDRGPGSASTLGEATFGGTVALFSKDPRDSFSFVPTYSVGSYDTNLTHLELNSGRLDALGGGKLIVGLQYNDTDTALTDSDMSRKTSYIKYVQPVGHHTQITFLSNYNYIRFNNPDLSSLTRAQIESLGAHFGLNNDRSSTNCACYNYQTKETDLEYLGVHSDIGEHWSIDDKLYTYAYNNESHESPYIGTKSGAKNNTQMGGYYKVNKYRAIGDTLQVTRADDHGELRFGGWFEYTHNDRSSVAIDYADGGALDYKSGKSPSSAYKYLMEDRLRTTQLYLEYAWHITDRLTVTPGIKSIIFTRDIDAPINQTTKTPLYYQQTWRKRLGYLAANYLLSNQWSLYAQAAQGFLGPNLNEFYVTDPSKNQARPSQTMNYQFGTVYKSGRFNADADVYWINYKNYVFSTTLPGTTDALYYVAKGAYIKGLEAEATYYLGAGIGVFANGSLQSARFKESDLRLPNVPDRTAAVGVNYQHAGWFASVYDKYVGPQWAYNSSFNPDQASSVTATASSGGFWQASMALGYGHRLNSPVIKSYKVRLQMDNLTGKDHWVINSISSGVPTYYVSAGRTWFLSLSLEI
ncbi:TonB-dependent receptor [Frateuria aurantia]